MKVMIFDVGGTEIKYSVMDDAMNRYESGSIPTPSDSQPHFLETLAQLYRPHRDEVDGIALSRGAATRRCSSSAPVWAAV